MKFNRAAAGGLYAFSKHCQNFLPHYNSAIVQRRLGEMVHINFFGLLLEERKYGNKLVLVVDMDGECLHSYMREAMK